MATQTQSFLQGEMVDEKYALVRYLGGSNHSSVFLTQYGGVHPKDAAIKLTPAPPGNAEARLSGWRLAANVSHPHLVRILDMGRCEVGNAAMLYVVTELADENLAQILPERPLTPEEAREMLASLLDALVFLHSRGFVHGHIKPSNIMAVGDQLKLSSDGICRLGEVAANGGVSLYDPPEGNRGGASTAGDIWSLGMTLVEVLTQQLPEWNSSDRRDPLPPENMPPPYPEIVRHCLRRESRNRWPAATIQARVPRAVAPPAPTPTPAPVVVPAERVEERAKIQTRDTIGNLIGKGAVVMAAVSAAARQLRAKWPAMLAAANTAGKALREKWTGVRAKAVAGGHELRQKWPAVRGAGEEAGRELPARWPAVRAAVSAAVHTLREKRYALGAVVGVVAIILAGVMLVGRSNTPDVAQSAAEATATAPAPSRIEPARKDAATGRAGHSAVAPRRGVTAKRLEQAPERVASRPERVAPQPKAVAKQLPPAIPATQGPAPGATSPVPSSASTSGFVAGRVLVRVMPDVPRQASNTIWGTVRVAVRVSVDALGNVTQAQLQSAGPSRYFARLSAEAARKWRFVAPTRNGQATSSVWLLHFGYRRDGTGVDPSQLQP